MFTGFIEFTGKTKGEDFKFVTHGYGDFLKNQYDLEKSSDNVKAAFDKDNQPVNALGHFYIPLKVKILMPSPFVIQPSMKNTASLSITKRLIMKATNP